MERLQTGQDRSSTSKVSRLNTVPTGQRYAMVMPSYFSSLSRFNAKKPSLYQHDMQRKTILAFRPTVCLSVTSVAANTCGCDSGRIGPTRCALIDAALDDRWRTL